MVNRSAPCESTFGLALPLLTALAPAIAALGLAANAAAAESLPLDADDALLEKIAALPDNSWLKLPPVKTAGDLSWLDPKSDYRRQGPRVRDYTNKMVWAPDRRRALYCGAGHNIHPLNDVWEYDLAANTWVCLFAPDPAVHRNRDEAWYREHAVLRDKSIRTPRGAPLRPAHTWWGLCYDSDRRRLVFWDAHKGLIFTNRKLLAAALGLEPASPLLAGSGSGPGEAWVFEFDPARGTWQDVLTGAPKSYESSQLEYLSRHRTLWLHSGRTYVLDADRRTWRTNAADAAQMNSNGAVTAYDPVADKVVLVSGRKTLVYDGASQTWTTAIERGPDTIRIPHGTFCYDSAAKKFVLYTHTPDDAHPGARLWLYDLAANAWTNPQPAAPQDTDSKAGAHGTPQLSGVAGYYDVARNVTVIYSSRETWVYRAKRVTR